jgi:Transposase DDE domain
MADLGYFALKRLLAFMRQGIYFLLRYKAGVLVWNEQGQLMDLVQDLPQQEGELFDQPVRVGASKQVAARLLAQKVPKEVLEQRREQLKERAHKQNKPINPRLWDLVQWTILLTNVPTALLSAQEAFQLQRARWQIELLFKLWKEHGKVDEWSTAKPERILCEVYAKLLAMVVQHWLLLLSCWQDPHRSLESVAEVVREHVPLLVYGLTRQLSLTTALRLLCQALAGQCSIPARQTRLSTSRLLLGEEAPGLT